MKSKFEDSVAQVAEDTFASLAFLLPAMEDDEMVSDGPCSTSVRVEFSGHFSGWIVVSVSPKVLSALAANMLGLKGLSSTSVQQQHDALRELSNVVCGNLLPVIATPQDLFHVHTPHILPDDESREMFAGRTPDAHAKLQLDCGQAIVALHVDQASAVLAE